MCSVKTASIYWKQIFCSVDLLLSISPVQSWKNLLVSVFCFMFVSRKKNRIKHLQKKCLFLNWRRALISCFCLLNNINFLFSICFYWYLYYIFLHFTHFFISLLVFFCLANRLLFNKVLHAWSWIEFAHNICWFRAGGKTCVAVFWPNWLDLLPKWYF